MATIGENCKLCLKFSLEDTGLGTLGEDLFGKLKFLQMDLDQSGEYSNSVCKECEGKIENAFSFKSCIVNTQGVEIKTHNGTIAYSITAGESSVEKVPCHLCKKMVNALSVISLAKLLKDDNMMDVFQRHIPEIGLKTTDIAKVCDFCQTSLAGFSTLVASWSVASGWNGEDMKGDIDNYEMVVVKEEKYDDFSDPSTNSSCPVDVSDSVKSEKKAKGNKGETIVKVKTEVKEISDSSESVSLNMKGLKKEEMEDLEIEYLQLKNEEIDIKPENEEGPSSSTTTTNDSSNSILYREVSNITTATSTNKSRKPPPKTVAQRSKEYRDRKKKLRGAKPPPKSVAQRSKEYRERQKDSASRVTSTKRVQKHRYNVLVNKLDSINNTNEPPRKKAKKK